MKKTLVALAALAAVGAASAQSSVTLYGVVDVNVAHQKGRTTLTSMGSGGLNGSRWGLRGTEDLGGGLKGTFRLESGFSADTGASNLGGRLFGRHSTVGLEGGFGSVRLGRTLTPIGVLSDESATLGTKGADLMSAAGMLGASEFYRTDNSITYDTPNMGGLTASAQYSLGYNSLNTATAPAVAVGPEAVNRTGRQYGFNVIYKGGPIQAGLGYINLRSAAATALAGSREIRALQGNLGWNFGVAGVRGVFERDDYGTAEDPTFLGAEVTVPLGAFTGSLGYGRLRDTTGLAGVRDNANLWTVQGVYNLSKRTALYTFYTHVSNPGPGATPLSTAVAGTTAVRPGFLRTAGTPAAPSLLGESSRQLQIGVRHSF